MKFKKTDKNKTKQNKQKKNSDSPMFHYIVHEGLSHSMPL